MAVVCGETVFCMRLASTTAWTLVLNQFLKCEPGFTSPNPMGLQVVLVLNV